MISMKEMMRTSTTKIQPMNWNSNQKTRMKKRIVVMKNILTVTMNFMRRKEKSVKWKVMLVKSNYKRVN